jgi:chemotaxis methyl-accepting protein methylase
MLQTHSKDAAYRLLTQRRDLLPVAVAALVIGVTEFFRDQAVFHAFRDHVLPVLAAGDRPLRVWSAGCSSGEELYSLAILLSQAGLLDRSFLLGTDCRGDAIEQARAAEYRASAVEHLEPSIRSRYFEAKGSHWLARESLRRTIHWKVADLTQRIEEGPWDVILWRNLAVYLNPDPVAAINGHLARVLAPGGFLIVGKAEHPPASLGLSFVSRCIYQKKKSGE